MGQIGKSHNGAYAKVKATWDGASRAWACCRGRINRSRVEGEPVRRAGAVWWRVAVSVLYSNRFYFSTMRMRLIAVRRGLPAPPNPAFLSFNRYARHHRRPHLSSTDRHKLPILPGAIKFIRNRQTACGDDALLRAGADAARATWGRTLPDVCSGRRHSRRRAPGPQLYLPCPGSDALVEEIEVRWVLRVTTRSACTS